MKQSDQRGFTAVEALLVLILVAILGFTGFYVYNAQRNTNKSLDSAADSTLSNPKTTKTTSTTTVPKTDYDQAKVATIDGFDKASDSLKAALINSFYDQTKKDCDADNAGVSAEARNTKVMTVHKMVRDDFARVQFCGSGGTSVLAKVDGTWQKVASLAMAPGCAVVDQYKISKDITATCFIEDGSSKNVTYL